MIKINITENESWMKFELYYKLQSFILSNFPKTIFILSETHKLYELIINEEYDTPKKYEKIVINKDHIEAIEKYYSIKILQE